MVKNDHGLNQESIQDINRTLLLNLLRKEDVCSRVHLAKRSHLKQATVTNIINVFIEWGLVREVGFLIGNKGRRSIGISINKSDFGVLGIRLARKNYTVGIFNLSGEMISAINSDIPAVQMPRETFDKILNDSKKLVNESKKDRKIIAIGMAIPGPYSVKRGRIELMTGVLGWNEIPIQDELSQAFNLPVFIEQDANTGALAQYWYNEEGYGNDVLVYIADGQGVGAGIICNGSLLKGCIGVAGEIGHTTINYKGPKCACGNFGCLENYCSSIAFVKEVNKELNLTTEYTFPEVVQLLNDGNDKVKELFKRSCENLAIGIVNIINSFNPGIVIIGDEMSHIAPELMLETVKKEVELRVLPEIYANTKITMSVVKKDSMVHGAAIVAINDIFNRPEKYFNNIE